MRAIFSGCFTSRFLQRYLPTFWWYGRTGVKWHRIKRSPCIKWSLSKSRIGFRLITVMLAVILLPKFFRDVRVGPRPQIQFRSVHRQCLRITSRYSVLVREDPFLVQN